MITLDTDLNLIYRLFNVSPKKLSNEYSGMSIEQVMEAEAAQGNASAANFTKEILHNPVKLIEFFKLNDAGNRYSILRNMNDQDLEDLLPLLEQQDLITGLNFFTKDKLLKLVESLPKEQLVKYVFEMFSPEQVMKLMPERQLDKVLSSPNMDKGLQLKCLKSFKPEVLAQMIEAVTGKSIQTSSNGGKGGGLDIQSLLSQLEALPDDKFQEAILNMPKGGKQALLLLMAQQDPKLFQLFDADAYTGIISQKKEKQDMIKASSAIDPEQLVKMLQQLPQDLTAIVVTQIDPQKFADVLIANFKNVLSQIIAG